MHREVRVKPAFEHEYPDLVPGRWYTAAAVAALVKGLRILEEGPEVQFRQRLLSPAHFEFRGGSPRTIRWLGVHSRRVDRDSPSNSHRLLHA